MADENKSGIIQTAMNFIKEKPVIAAGIGLAAIILLPKLLKRHTRRRRRSFPRSVGYTPRRRVKRAYNRAGRRLKAWQIKGSLAARRHMAQIRRMR